MNLRMPLPSQIVRTLLMAMAFFALPLTFIGFELVAFRNSLAREEDVRNQGTLLNSLQTLKNRKSFAGDLRQWFEEGLKKAETATSPRLMLADMRQRGPRHFKVSMTFLILRPDGQADEELSDVRVPDQLAPFLSKDLENLDRGNLEGWKKRLKAYQDFFGPMVFQLGAHPAGIHPAGFSWKSRFLYISPPSKVGRLLIFLDRPADWDIQEPQWDLTRHLSGIPEERGAVLHPGAHPDELKKILGPGFATGYRASLLLGPSTRQAIRVDDWLWAQIPIDRSARIILGRPDTSRQELHRFRRNLLLVLLALFGGSTLVFLRWMNSHGGAPLRLSIRLFLLLAYVVGLPLLVYGLTAKTLGRDLNEVRQRQWQNRQFAILKEMDLRKSDFIGTLELSLMQAIDLGGKESNLKAQLLKNVKNFNTKFHPLNIMVFDNHGVKCFESGAGTSDLPPAFQILLQKACTMAMKVPSPPGMGQTDDLALAMAEEQGINPELFITILTEKPNRLNDIGFDNSNMAFILTPVGGTSEKPAFIIVTTWFHHMLEQRYIEQFLAKFQRGEPSIFLAAQYPWGKQTVPEDSPFRECAEEVWQESKDARTAWTLRVALKSGSWLLTGNRGPNLKWALTMAGSRTNERDAPEVVFHERIGLIALLLSLSGLVIARLLAAAFLGPIRELTLGVDALTRGDYSHRIGYIDGAEFGRLGTAFNQMQEDLKDLELARILQERIYPSVPALLGHGWEIFADCHPMTEVGGDFYDFFPFDDGRWFIVIGDVSGHGTPAALIVAMAKGLFSHARKQQDPTRILNDVHSVLGRVLPRKRMMMTCFAVVFDPATGLLQCSNAGHNYPFLGDRHGGATEFRLSGMPLGHGRKRPDSKRETSLEPGGFLFLYTDGLIEAADSQGEPIGYEAVQKVLSSLKNLGAREGVEHLKKWHESKVGSDPQADDITLLLLKQRRLISSR